MTSKKLVVEFTRSTSHNDWFGWAPDDHSGLQLCKRGVKEIWPNIPARVRTIWVTVEGKPTKGKSLGLARHSGYEPKQGIFFNVSQALKRNFTQDRIYATVEYYA